MRPRSIFTALLVGAFFASPAAAQEIGTATAVNPLTESTPPGAATQTLMVGARIVHKERIHTTPSGTVQLAFLDKSTLSIAPNTSIMIDEYVYDPGSGRGHMLTTLTEGALRFVGGAISHQGEATITTPAAAIGIRGGTVTVVFGPNGAQIFNHFGIIKVYNGAGSVTMNVPDLKVIVANWNTPPSQPVHVLSAEFEPVFQLFGSKKGQNAGVPGLTTAPIGECGVLGLQSNNCPNTFWSPNYGQYDANQLGTQATQQGSGTTAPPPRYTYPGNR